MPCRTPFYRTHFNGQEKKYRKRRGWLKKKGTPLRRRVLNEGVGGGSLLRSCSSDCKNNKAKTKRK